MRLDDNLLSRSDVVIEQALTGHIVALSALGGAAFLAVAAHGYDGFLNLIPGQQQAALRGKDKAICDALSRVIDEDAPVAYKEPALAVVHHNALEFVLYLAVAHQPPVIDLVRGEGKIPDFNPKDIEQIGDNLFRRAALGIGLGDLGVEPLVHSGGC